MAELSPSILAADFNILGEQIGVVEESGVKYLHIDVMDGNFVNSISFGMPVISSIRASTELIFDVHLMIEDPIRYLEEFKMAGADIITIHVEACKDVEKTISKIKELGLKAGVTLKPGTSLDEIEPLLKMVDMVLVMSVEPGFGGQAFIESSLDRIRNLRQRAKKIGANIDIEVDGGINKDNVEEVVKAGANIIVSGTSVFKGDIKKNIEEFQKVFDKTQRG